MKPNPKWIIVVLVLTMLLAVCGAMAEETADTVIGVWDIEPYDLMVMLGTPKENMEAQKDIIAEMRTTMEFTEDGRLIMAATHQDETMTREFGYSVQGNWMYINGEPAPFTIADNVLTLYYDYDDPEVAYVCMNRQGTKTAANGIIGFWDMDVEGSLKASGWSDSRIANAFSNDNYADKAPFCTLEFRPDGMVHRMGNLYSANDESTAEYILEGDQLSFDNSPFFTIDPDGDQIILAFDNQVMIFNRRIAPKAAETSKSAVFGKWKQVSENEYMGDSEFYYEFSEGNKLKATEVRSGEIVRSYEMTDGYVMNSETTGVVKDEYDEHPFKIDGDVMTIDVEGNGTSFLTLKKEK